MTFSSKYLRFCSAGVILHYALLSLLLLSGLAASIIMHGRPAQQMRTSFLWPPYVVRQTIIFLPCGFYLLLSSSSSFFFSSPNLSGRTLDVYHTSTHGMSLSANLGCRSEMCCTRLARNKGRKNDAKNRLLGTIAQLCRAVSSQLRHISTIGKNC